MKNMRNPFPLSLDDITGEQLMPPQIESYTDQQVLSAVNGCIDLLKFAELPQKIKNRFAKLLSARRVGSVCFMDSVGLGLRVYRETVNVSQWDEDEVSVDPEGKEDGKLDLEGYWLRCPSTVFKNRQEQILRIITDERGVRWLRFRTGQSTQPQWSDDPEPRLIHEDLLLTNYYNWTTNRSNAVKFKDIKLAEAVAKAIKGIVVKN